MKKFFFLLTVWISSWGIPTLALASTPQILVFVSSSMPTASIAQWMAQARTQGHTALIMRGFVHNSLSATKDWLSPIIKTSGGAGGVSIDPILFTHYHIHAVPAVVVVKKNDTARVVVYGNVSLMTALQAIQTAQDKNT